MNLSADQLQPILSAKLRDALQRRAPDANRKGWSMRAADEIGVSLTAFNNWFYGDNLPGAAAWEALFLYFPDLRHDVMAGITDEKASAAERELAELKAGISRLNQHAEGVLGRLVADREEHDAEPIPFKGPIK